MTILAYIGKYYAISAAVPLTLTNYLIVGWFSSDFGQFCLTSWKLSSEWLSCPTYQYTLSSEPNSPTAFSDKRTVSTRLRNAPTSTGAESILLVRHRDNHMDTHVRPLLRWHLTPSFHRSSAASSPSRWSGHPQPKKSRSKVSALALTKCPGTSSGCTCSVFLSSVV
jgi:hypothetical protein